MADFDEASLLDKLKLTMGDFTLPTAEMKAYYGNYLSIAAAELRANDISETVLAGELGQCAIVLYAKTKIEGGDTAKNSTCVFLRNTLSVQTKGERSGNGEA